MFLAHLENAQKNAYLAIATALISADGRLDEKEKQMMEQYKVEMGYFNEDTSYMSLDTAVQEFTKSSDDIKKRVFFELIALAFADNECDRSEADFMDNIRKEFCLETKFYEACSTTVRDLYGIYERIETLVNNG